MSKLNLGDSLIMNSDIVEDGLEYKTGMTYNGKPVYRMSGVKTGNWTTQNNITLVSIANLSKVIKIDAVTHFNGGGGFILIPYIYSVDYSALTEYASVFSTGTEIRAHLKRNEGFTDINWTVYYTKTTD